MYEAAQLTVKHGVASLSLCHVMVEWDLWWWEWDLCLCRSGCECGPCECALWECCLWANRFSCDCGLWCKYPDWGSSCVKACKGSSTPWLWNWSFKWVSMRTLLEKSSMSSPIDLFVSSSSCSTPFSSISSSSPPSISSPSVDWELLMRYSRSIDNFFLTSPLLLPCLLPDTFSPSVCSIICFLLSNSDSWPISSCLPSSAPNCLYSTSILSSISCLFLLLSLLIQIVFSISSFLLSSSSPISLFLLFLLIEIFAKNYSLNF